MKRFDIKWIAALLFIVGGTTIALKLPHIKYAFPCFVVAHGISIYDFYKTHKNIPLILQNAYFFVVNIIATYIWFTQ